MLKKFVHIAGKGGAQFATISFFNKFLSPYQEIDICEIHFG